MHLVQVTRSPNLRARIIRRKPLTYAAGADPAIDRPAHVRAASALAWVNDRLLILQDDANFLALTDLLGDQVEATALPPGPGGKRQFDDTRGNKAHKLDLESCITVDGGGETMVIAFGSGSTAARERIVIARGWDAGTPTVDVVPAPGLYTALRDAHDFAGSELNIEGAVLLEGRELRLFSRGNGAPKDGRRPLNATCSLDWPMLWSYLADRSLPPPWPYSITRYALGSVGGTELGFTDATAWGRGVMYAAAAEDSPDAVRDGPVAGSAIGVIAEDGSARCAHLLGEDGQLFPGKVEGVAPGRDAGTLYAVADEDDPGRPSELCIIELEGDWRGGIGS